MSVPGFVAATTGRFSNNGRSSWLAGAVSPDPAVGGSANTGMSLSRRVASAVAGGGTVDHELLTVPAARINQKYVARVYVLTNKVQSVNDGMRGLWLGFFSVDDAAALRFDGDNQGALDVGAGFTVTGTVSGQDLLIRLINSAGLDLEYLLLMTTIYRQVGNVAQ